MYVPMLCKLRSWLAEFTYMRPKLSLCPGHHISQAEQSFVKRCAHLCVCCRTICNRPSLCKQVAVWILSCIMSEAVRSSDAGCSCCDYHLVCLLSTVIFVPSRQDLAALVDCSPKTTAAVHKQGAADTAQPEPAAEPHNDSERKKLVEEVGALKQEVKKWKSEAEDAKCAILP